MNNNTLTLLLTLKDRPEYTKRWLAYASEFHCPFSILIADGSKTEENAGIVKNYFSTLSIHYYRYPFDQDFQTYYCKVANAVTHVKTPFVIKADNDDFYDFSVLSQGVNLLQNGTCTSCHIKTLNFSIKKPLSIHFYSNINQPDLRQYAHERVSLYFSGAPGAYYNIHSTTFYRDIWKDIRCLGFSNLRLHELLIDVASYANGNIATTTSYGYFREVSGQGNTSQLEANTLKEIITPQWGSENALLAKYLVDILVEKDNLNQDVAHNIYYDGLRNFLAVDVVRGILLDASLINQNRKYIYQLVLKDIISRSKLNIPIRKMFSIKNIIQNKETQSLPLKEFLEKWYFGGLL